MNHDDARVRRELDKYKRSVEARRHGQSSGRRGVRPGPKPPPAEPVVDWNTTDEAVAAADEILRRSLQDDPGEKLRARSEAATRKRRQEAQRRFGEQKAAAERKRRQAEAARKQHEAVLLRRKVNPKPSPAKPVTNWGTLEEATQSADKILGRERQADEILQRAREADEVARQARMRAQKEAYDRQQLRKAVQRPRPSVNAPRPKRRHGFLSPAALFVYAVVAVVSTLVAVVALASN